MATAYRRKDGRWCATMDVPDGSNKRKRISRYAPTRREALARLTEAQAGFQGGIPAADNKQTLAGYLTRWLESVQPTVKPRTFESYSGEVHNHIIPAIGGIKLTQLQPDSVETMLRELADELSPASARLTHAILKAALSKAVKWELVGRNVAKIADGVRVPKTEAASLDEAHTHTLLSTKEPLTTLALMVGLRRGEIIGLRWQDINLESGTLKVTHNMVAGVLSEPKSNSSRRTITLPGTCTAMLKEQKYTQAQAKLKSGIGNAYNGGDYVFVYGPKGDPLTPAELYKRFGKALKNAGLEPIKFHALRHTCASMMLAKGISPHTVAKVLGHSNVSLTLSIYAHVSDEQQDEAARVMDAFMG